MVEIFKLILGRDSEIWSRFVFELVIWTQPLRPLCLWQCLEIIVVDHFLKLYKVLSQTTCLQFVALGNIFANCKNCRPTLFFANCTSCCSKICIQILQIIIAHIYFLYSFCLKILQIVVPEKSFQIVKIVFPETLFANYTNSCYG